MGEDDLDILFLRRSAAFLGPLFRLWRVPCVSQRAATGAGGPQRDDDGLRHLVTASQSEGVGARARGPVDCRRRDGDGLRADRTWLTKRLSTMITDIKAH